jgi:hypothetical protein
MTIVRTNWLLTCLFAALGLTTVGKLADVGYKCVNLKGGILAWKEAGMPVIKEE